MERSSIGLPTLLSLAGLCGFLEVAQCQTYSIAEIDTFGGGQNIGFALNNAGQVTGGAAIPDNSTEHAFLYTHGAMIDLGTLGGNFSVGSAVNDEGQVAGTSSDAAGVNHAFLFSKGVMHDLGTLGGSYSATVVGSIGNEQINTKGEVIGVSGTRNGEDHAFVYSHGTMTDLGTLGTGTKVSPNAINNADDIVGVAFTIGTTAPHAFLYRRGRMLDLNDHVDPDSPLKSDVVLLDAVAISNSGYILVLGDNRRSGKSLAYLLKECDRHDDDFDHDEGHNNHHSHDGDSADGLTKIRDQNDGHHRGPKSCQQESRE